MAAEHPLLLPKLQSALTCLYGNNNPHQNNRHEAHEFLLGFKSSNIRRAVVSRVQSQKDRVRKTSSNSSTHTNNGSNTDGNANNIDLSLSQLAEEQYTGSIFLSCLALILQSCNNHDGHERSHERIFAAQTLKHRCRSVKKVETLDIEAEDGVECGVARLVLAWEEMRAEAASAQINTAALGEKSSAILNAWLERYVPMLVHRCAGGGNVGVGVGGSRGSENGTLCNGAELLALVLQRHSSSLLANTNDAEDGEQREGQIKGTLIMLTLAVAMYTSAFCDYEEEHHYYQQHQHQQQHNQQARSPWANSVLSDLGSALSITALRVRYRPVNDKNATPQPEPSCPPLIDMLVNAVNLVKESAEHLFSQTIQQHPQQNQEAIQTAIQQAHQYAIRRSIAACIKTLPETVLLPPGQEDSGHRIPSVDRACLRAASNELRSVGGVGTNPNTTNGTGTSATVLAVGTGMDKAWKVLLESERQHQQQQQQAEEDASATRLLECCEAWSRYAAVPIPVIDATVRQLAVSYLHPSRQQQSPRARAAAFQYLASIFESASVSLTAGDILAAALGVGAGGHRSKGGTGGKGPSSNKKNANKNKRGKSKARHNKRLGQAVASQDEDGGAAEVAAEEELLARRNAACVAAAAAFGISLADGAAVEEDAGLRLAATTESTSVHGVCSTVAAAANSVLPHLLFLERGDSEGGGEGGMPHVAWRLELFSAITAAIRRMCASPVRELRALAYEPLMVLHAALNSVACVSLRMEQVAVDAICECALALATSCGYYQGYFDNLYEDNDEELEVERNDVRDVARSVCSLDSGAITGTQKSPSILILERIVTACNAAMQHAASVGQLPPETVVHILSSLAKPLNKLGKNYKEQRSDIGRDILTTSLLALGSVCDQLNSSFESSSHSMSEILPLSRLACMGTASFSPMFSSLANVTGESAAAAASNSDAEKEMIATFRRTSLASLRQSIISTARIPELIAKSTLESTRYDVKGAMRGPGGEDHVGCIALLRLSHESDYLMSYIFEVYGSSILHDLSCLYQGLKTSELERGVGCDYGKGVTPVSRRVVLRVISRLALHEMKETNDQSGKGGTILQQLLQAPLGEMRSQKDHPFSADKVFRVCEASFDLSFFSPELVADLFENPSDDLGIMFETVITGYSRLSFSSEADVACQQWGRLRGGALSVLRTSLKENISEYCAKILSALTKAECEAATVQSNQGPDSGSNLFNDGVVGEEMMNAGAYIALIRECLDRIAKKKGEITEKSMNECRRCLSVLKDVAPNVMPLLLHQSPEANSHVDPRPTIAEAWFVTMTSLVSICRNHEQIAAALVGDDVGSFLGDSLSAAWALIFLKDLGTKKAPPPAIQRGMSLDGPQTLAINNFMSESMLLGPSILVAGGRSILSHIQVNDAVDQSSIGVTILAASLLRAVSGALPPWAVEDTPTLFRSMFETVGRDSEKFVQILSDSTKIKASSPLGAVNVGELLAGRYLDVSDRHIESFLHQSKAVTIKGDWRKLKVILKATCGGKKKDAGFNLKPQFTSWECERL